MTSSQYNHEEQVPSLSVRRLRSVAVASESLGLTGVVDLLEKTEEGSRCLIDYKKGSPAHSESGDWQVKENDAVQLAAYALMLQDQGVSVEYAAVYYAEMSKRRRYLICYDIADPKRLRHVAKVCESFASRIQFSVFEAALSSLMLAKLRAQLHEVINHDWDQIIFVDLGADDSSTPFSLESIGLPYVQRSRLTII